MVFSGTRVSIWISGNSSHMWKYKWYADIKTNVYNENIYTNDGMMYASKNE